MKSLVNQIKESMVSETKISRELKNDIVAEVDNVSPIAQEIVMKLKSYNGDKFEAFSAEAMEPILKDVLANHNGDFDLKINRNNMWTGKITLPGDAWLIKGTEMPACIFINLTGKYGDEHPWIKLKNNKYYIDNVSDASLRTY